MDQIQHYSSWRYEDPCPGVPINEIFPYSLRAAALYARNKDKPGLEYKFLEISGAIYIMKGIEYHFCNLSTLHTGVPKNQELRMKLSITDLGRDFVDQINRIMDHEIVAYINRVGQFYYFVTSRFVRDYMDVKDIKGLIPTVMKVYQFRNKYTAHRSIDWPKKDEGREFIHEMAFNHSRIFSIEGHRIWQLRTKEGYINFDLMNEHFILLREAYTILEKLMTAV